MKKLLITVVVAMVLVPIAAAGATDGYKCNTFRNHSGNVPGSYDAAFFYERGYGWFGPSKYRMVGSTTRRHKEGTHGTK